jgi:outer membrane translocation and assembly module TamA
MHLKNRSELTPPTRNLRLLILLCLWAMGGCVAVKNPPIGKPYVFENKVSLNAPLLDKEKQAIFREKLLDYLDDSLKVPTRSIIGFSQRVKPPLFDSVNIANSIRFMFGYLNSEGFYNSSLDTFAVKFDTTRRKTKFFGGTKVNVIEAKTHFFLKVGKGLRLDSIWNSFSNPELQRLSDSARKTSPLTKNSYYSKQAVAIELDRLASIFRNSGYMLMNRSGLLAEADTADLSLVALIDDPIQQQLAALKRQQDPTATLRFFERPGTDSMVFRKYVIDSVYIYPQTKVSDNVNTLITSTQFNELRNPQSKVVIKELENQFQERMLRRTNFLLPGQYYTDRYFFRTLNNYTQMGPWQQVDVRTLTRKDSIAKAIFHLFLYPAKKQNFQIDLEGSQNNNISVGNVLSGRFLAVGVSGTYRNRNVLKRGTQSVTTLRTGLELNNSASSGNEGLFQTLIISGNQSFSIPRLFWPFKFLDKRALDFRRTALNFGGIYTDRFDFFKQTSINFNLQWDIRKGKNTFSFSFPTFETVDTVSTDSLYKEIVQNPALAYSFTPGNVLSLRGSWERVLEYNNKRHSGFFRTSAEITVPGDYTLFGKEFFKFFRLEGLFIHNIRFARSSMAMRMFGGVGWDISGNKATMPFFRQFVAGGSNSMRAWSIRQLGLGNSLANDTAFFTDRFGDIQIEANFEYRMRLVRMFGYNLDGAVLLDIGNIWNHRPTSDGLGDFQWKYLYRDLALSLGYGIRWDLSFLVIRFDAGFKVKDPVRAGNGWLDTFEWKTANRLGINKRSNLAIQFGVGYPF